MPFAKARAEVAIEEFDLGEMREFFADFDDLIVLLIWRNEKSSSEGIVVVLCGIADNFSQTLAIAIIDTAIGNIKCHALTEFIQAVVFVYDELDVDPASVIH